MSKQISIVLGHQICGYCYCSPRKLLHGMYEVELYLLLSSPFSGGLEVFYILGLFYTVLFFTDYHFRKERNRVFSERIIIVIVIIIIIINL